MMKILNIRHHLITAYHPQIYTIKTVILVGVAEGML